MSKDNLIRSELVELAYDLKFESHFGLMWSLKPDSYLLWMEDFHRWIRKEHKLFINIFIENGYYGYVILNIINPDDVIEESFIFYDNYDNALENALLSVVKHIK